MAQVAAALAEATIVRTSWVCSTSGKSNFVRTILRLAQDRLVLRVVGDQRGCPTFADDVAAALLTLAPRDDARGIYHFCGDGETSRHGFADAIVAGARRRGHVVAERVVEITSAEYPTPARRPANSTLETSRVRALGIATRPWQPGLDTVLDVLCRKGTDDPRWSPLTGSPAGEAGGDRGIENPR